VDSGLLNGLEAALEKHCKLLHTPGLGSLLHPEKPLAKEKMQPS
jgi:hypothetical protein